MKRNLKILLQSVLPAKAKRPQKPHLGPCKVGTAHSLLHELCLHPPMRKDIRAPVRLNSPWAKTCMSCTASLNKGNNSRLTEMATIYSDGPSNVAVK